jgi:hypothetical protein
LPDFWSEGTAQWAAKHVVPESNDLESYLPAYFERPNRPINLPPSTGATPFSYGSAIWPVFLEEYFGVEIVRETFELLRVEPDPLVAVDRALELRGSSLREAWGTFALYNVATGTRSAAVGYRDAERYPLVASEVLDDEVPFRFEGVTSGLSATYFELPDGPLRSVRVETDRDASQGFVVPLENGVARIDVASEGEGELSGPGFVVIAGARASLQDATFAIEVAFPGRPGTERDSEDAGSPKAPSSKKAKPPSPTLSDESGCGVVARPAARGLGSLTLSLLVPGIVLRRRLRGKR